MVSGAAAFNPGNGPFSAKEQRFPHRVASRKIVAAAPRRIFLLARVDKAVRRAHTTGIPHCGIFAVWKRRGLRVILSRVALLMATGLYMAHGLLGPPKLLRAGHRSGIERPWLIVGAAVLHAGFLVSAGVRAGGLPVGSRLDSVALFLRITAVFFLAATKGYGLRGIAPLFWLAFSGCVGGMWLSPVRVWPISCNSAFSGARVPTRRGGICRRWSGWST